MNLVTGSTLSTFTGYFANHFDTFAANGNYCIINKEPIRVVTYNNITLPGYNSEPIDESYIPVSGYFPCVIVKDFRKEHLDKVESNTNTRVSNYDLKIKLNSDGYNFMESGKTISVYVDDRLFKKYSLDKKQNYFGLKYYYYDLKVVD